MFCVCECVRGVRRVCAFGARQPTRTNAEPALRSDRFAVATPHRTCPHRLLATAPQIMNSSLARVDALEQELERVRREQKQTKFQLEQLDATHKSALAELKDAKSKQSELLSQVSSSFAARALLS